MCRTSAPTAPRLNTDAPMLRYVAENNIGGGGTARRMPPRTTRERKHDSTPRTHARFPSPSLPPPHTHTPIPTPTPTPTDCPRGRHANVRRTRLLGGQGVHEGLAGLHGPHRGLQVLAGAVGGPPLLLVALAQAAAGGGG